MRHRRQLQQQLPNRSDSISDNNSQRKIVRRVIKKKLPIKNNKEIEMTILQTKEQVNTKKRKRILIRSRVLMSPTSTQSFVEIKSTKNRRRVTKTNRRILPTSIKSTEMKTELSLSDISTPSLIQNEQIKSIVETSQSPPYLTLSTSFVYQSEITRHKTVPRTYTYVVTRQHDNEFEITSSTVVREQSRPFTETLQLTSTVLLHIPIVTT